MLAEAGGTEADQTKPEVGGACQAWCSWRSGYSLIQKVNKVSVTLLDNWGNGGADFTRTIPFDKLKNLMSKAQVDAARDAGRLMGETPRGFHLAMSKNPPEEPVKLESDVRAVLEKATFTTDSLKLTEQLERGLYLKVNKVLASTGGIWDKKRGVHVFQQDPRELFDLQAGELHADAVSIEGMRASLKAGVKVVSAPQLFPTPPDLARRMVEVAQVRPGMRILEPSAGTGNLMRAVYEKVKSEEICLIAVERQHSLADNLAATFPDASVKGNDFLECNGDFGKFDRILMNPPFENGADIKHIKHALTFLKPGGRLVAICANGPRQQEQLKSLVIQNGGDWEELPEGSFEGTGVRTAMLTLTAASAPRTTLFD